MNNTTKTDGDRNDDISEVTASDVQSSIKPMKHFKEVRKEVDNRREAPSGMKLPYLNDDDDDDDDEYDNEYGNEYNDEYGDEYHDDDNDDEYNDEYNDEYDDDDDEYNDEYDDEYDDDIDKDGDKQWESSIEIQSLNMGIAHLRNDSRSNSGGGFSFNCHYIHCSFTELTHIHR